MGPPYNGLDLLIVILIAVGAAVIVLSQRRDGDREAAPPEATNFRLCHQDDPYYRAARKARRHPWFKHSRRTGDRSSQSGRRARGGGC